MAKCKDHPLDVPINEVQITGSLRVHGLLICLAVASSLVACVLSFYLMFRHATNYTQPKVQKQILRILLMVPVYTVACTLSIQFYQQEVYIASVYEFYESLVVASFFLLLCNYMHPDLEKLRQTFALIKPKPWIRPLRHIVVHIGRNKSGETADGLKVFNIIWLGVFQFCVVKFLGALTKCITEAADVYCAESNNPSHAKIWVTVIEILSLVTAMLCLLQFYQQSKHVLAPHNPLLKFVAIKVVIFLFFVQTFVFNLLTREGGPIQPSATISYPSWAVGIPSTILCIEMAAVSILHLWAYPYAVHRVDASQQGGKKGRDRESINLEATTSYIGIGSSDGNTADAFILTQPTVLVSQGGTMGWRAFADALNFLDIFQGVIQGTRFLVLETKKSRSTELDQFPNSRYEDMGDLRTNQLSEALMADSSPRGLERL
ncbi:organic solute transporter Ostalpha-domain-containing protein [Camillea tinctor]|nr:organic solute transporter Ostalpha-domain-containing protein [Camillea tinctor]